jgi:hypothetical protein
MRNRIFQSEIRNSIRLLNEERTAIIQTHAEWMRQQEAIINKKIHPVVQQHGSAARCAANAEEVRYDNIKKKGYGEGTAKYQ